MEVMVEEVAANENDVPTLAHDDHPDVLYRMGIDMDY
jgi:hypothetical protein